MKTASSLYIHIPFCRSKCPYCSFYSVPISSKNAISTLSAMILELHRYDLPPLETVYIGGGSPTCIPADLLLNLISELKTHISPHTEFTIEANPAQLNPSLLKDLRATGVNRLSLGAQSFIPKELTLLGRTHTPQQTFKTVDCARKTGFFNVSIDLIFAIPGSTLASWGENLDTAISLAPDHISAYSLTYENGTEMARNADSGLITPIDQDTDRAMYDLAIEKLTAAGLTQYEISNFARPGFECLHNLNYWANNPYIGIGPAATTYVNRTRSTNIAHIDRYTQAINAGRRATETSETLSNLDYACETAVLNLRRTRGINLAEFKAGTGYDALQLFAEAIERYQKLGFLTVNADSIRLTRAGLPIADSVLCDFAAV